MPRHVTGVHTHVHTHTHVHSRTQCSAYLADTPNGDSHCPSQSSSCILTIAWVGHVAGFCSVMKVFLSRLCPRTTLRSKACACARPVQCEDGLISEFLCVVLPASREHGVLSVRWAARTVPETEHVRGVVILAVVGQRRYSQCHRRRGAKPHRGRRWRFIEESLK